MAGSYSMKAVLGLTGLQADRLRAWERRYGAIRPERRGKGAGRRVYSEEELQRLRQLHELVRLGHPIGGIARRSSAELTRLLARHQGAAGSGAAFDVDFLLQAIESFRLDELRSGVARLRYSLSPREFSFRLVPLLMAKVGEGILSGSLDVSQEHAVSDLLRHALRQIFEELAPLEDPRRAPMVFGTPEAHLHDIGILLAAMQARFHGIPARFLGPNLPAPSLERAVRGFQASALVLGLSSPAGAAEAKALRLFLAELERKLPRSVSLWLGGPGAALVQRRHFQRDIWVFHRLEDFEEKLQARERVRTLLRRPGARRRP